MQIGDIYKQAKILERQRRLRLAKERLLSETAGMSDNELAQKLRTPAPRRRAPTRVRSKYERGHDGIAVAAEVPITREDFPPWLSAPEAEVEA